MRTGARACGNACAWSLWGWEVGRKGGQHGGRRRGRAGLSIVVVSNYISAWARGLTRARAIHHRTLLGEVGRAVAVNPDRRLRALARERGWEVRARRRPVSPSTVTGVVPSQGMVSLAGVCA